MRKLIISILCVFTIILLFLNLFVYGKDIKPIIAGGNIPGTDINIFIEIFPLDFYKEKLDKLKVDMKYETNSTHFLTIKLRNKKDYKQEITDAYDVKVMVVGPVSVKKELETISYDSVKYFGKDFDFSVQGKYEIKVHFKRQGKDISIRDFINIEEFKTVLNSSIPTPTPSTEVQVNVPTSSPTPIKEAPSPIPSKSVPIGERQTEIINYFGSKIRVEVDIIKAEKYKSINKEDKLDEKSTHFITVKLINDVTNEPLSNVTNLKIKLVLGLENVSKELRKVTIEKNELYGSDFDMSKSGTYEVIISFYWGNQIFFTNIIYII